MIMLKSTSSLGLLLAFSALLFFTSCASLTGFQTGRTVGKGNGQFMISLNASQSPDFDFDSNDSTEVDHFFFPNVEMGGRLGITDKFDLGLRVNSFLNIAVDGKYQLIGDQSSDVALSVGAGLGTFGLISALWNAQIPLYFSFHPAENIDLYLNPRYIVQFAAGDLNTGLHYFGGNAGILFGRKVKFGIDAGLYNLDAFEAIDLQSIATVGIGVIIPIN